MHLYAEVSGFVWFKRSKPEMEIIATNNVKKKNKKKNCFDFDFPPPVKSGSFWRFKASESDANKQKQFYSACEERSRRKIESIWSTKR